VISGLLRTPARDRACSAPNPYRWTRTFLSRPKFNPDSFSDVLPLDQYSLRVKGEDSPYLVITEKYRENIKASLLGLMAALLS